MTLATSTNGTETHVRAIVFRDGEGYVAQCLEFDIAAYGDGIEAALASLDLTVEAECAMRNIARADLSQQIGAAPVYYHELWEKSTLLLKTQVPVVDDSSAMELKLAA